MTVTAQVGAKYQVVIPKEVRNVLAIQPGGRLIFLVDGDVVFVRPRTSKLHRDTPRAASGIVV